MIHLYCGEGKGKTTAAMGLALRAVGRGQRVAICQFLKSGDSGERLALARLEGVTLLPVPEKMKFLFRMTDAEREQVCRETGALFEQARALVRAGGCELLVLDEVCAAVTAGLLPEGDVLELLTEAAGVEVVLTGRDPTPALRERAHYLTEMTLCRHPYEQGVPARRGVEW